MPRTAPDWINNEISVERLEYVINRKGWAMAYRRQLGEIAGCFKSESDRPAEMRSGVVDR